MKKIVWPQAMHLISMLLQEDPNNRPKTLDQVLQHPFLAPAAGPAKEKRVVMSCPEWGTLDRDGGPPYDQHVMDKVSELSDLDFVKLGFDRAGTSTAREKDGALFAKAFALRDAGNIDEAVELDTRLATQLAPHLHTVCSLKCACRRRRRRRRRLAVLLCCCAALLLCCFAALLLCSFAALLLCCACCSCCFAALLLC